MYCEAMNLSWRIQVRCLDDGIRGLKHKRECGFRGELPTGSAAPDAAADGCQWSSIRLRAATPIRRVQ